VRVDVLLTPGEVTPAHVTGRVVVVLDILRASTSIVTALRGGARAVIPFVATEDAVRTAKQYARGEVLLAGERNMVAIPGFDLGNSPREFTPERVKGHTVLLTTTNGTRALLSVEDAHEVLVAGFANCAATVEYLRTHLISGRDVTVLCAGTDGAFSLEDATCAGRIVRLLVSSGLFLHRNDGARVTELLAHRYGPDTGRLFADASHARRLAEAGFGADLDVCGAIDTVPLVAIYRDRAITRLDVPSASAA
jgi:2-phosphosulfolactate phosphatase